MSATTAFPTRPRAAAVAAVAAAVVCGTAAIAVGGRESRDEPVVAGHDRRTARDGGAAVHARGATHVGSADDHPGQHHHDHRGAVTAELARRGSDDRHPRPARVDVAPASVSIPDIDVTGVPVRPVGVTADGELEIPGATEAGWYRLGAAPGQAGATVVAAHISWQGSTGPFLRLAELEPGAFVDLALADGATRRYQVVARAQYGKLALPKEEIWRTTGPETLVLITCGGAFNREIRRYADNIVVTAVPSRGVAGWVTASDRRRRRVAPPGSFVSRPVLIGPRANGRNRAIEATSGVGWRPSIMSAIAATWLRTRMSIARPMSRAHRGVGLHQLLDEGDRGDEHFEAPPGPLRRRGCAGG